MRIDLPDLGENFKALGLNDGNHFDGRAAGKSLVVRPGAYLLTRDGVVTKWGRESEWRNITLKEFAAPAASIDKTYVLHQPIVEATAGRPLRVTATIAAPEEIKGVTLVAYPPEVSVRPTPRVEPPPRVQPGGDNGAGTGRRNTGGARSFAMTRTHGFEYSADIPGEELHPGILRYAIAVQGSRGFTTYPAEIDALPTDWDFFGKRWEARIVPPGAPILLFDAAADAAMITADHREVRYEIVPSDRPGTSALEVMASDLAAGEHDHSFRYFFKDKINGRQTDPGTAAEIVLFGKSATDRPCIVQLALVTEDGIAYGATATVEPRYGAYSVPISALQQVRAPNIPHGYPVFIPFWSSVSTSVRFDINRVESVLISIGPGIPADEYAQPHGLQIERMWLDQRR
jgi:hypothetical protein